MPFPKGYEEAQVYGGYERLTPGGHRCIIRNAAFKFSKAGNYMLELEIDTANDDAQPQFFLNKYIADNQAGRDPVWRCTHRIIVDERVEDKDGKLYGLSNLKRLNTAVADSNINFEVNDKFYVAAADAENKTSDPLVMTNQRRFCEQFKDKKIGVVFREEEYADPVTAELRVSVKPFYICAYDKAEEQKVPDRKCITPTYAPAAGANGQEGFLQIPDGLDDAGLPFN